MVLTNAVYFKGIWKYPFKSQSTHKEFFVSPKQSVEVHMMSQTEISNMVIGLEEVSRPGAGDALQGRQRVHGGAPPRCGRGSKTVDWLVRRLKPKRLAFELKAMRFVPLTTLKKMRMRKLFSSTADLTNFAPDGGLLVNGAIHKALIQVDEGQYFSHIDVSVLIEE
nr:serine protease inhibitor A3G-like [Penaeus vannamei]